MDVGNLNSNREALGETCLEDERESDDVIAQVHHRIAERRVPGRISSQLLQSRLEAREVGKLPDANRIESEIDSQRFESAVGPTGSVLSVPLVEPGPLPEGPEAEHTPRKQQCIVTNAEHALSARWVGKNGDECQCNCGNADQRTAHRLSAGV